MANSPRAPKGWRVVRLSEVAEVAFSSVDKKIIEGEIPVKLCNYTDVFYNHRIRPGMAFMQATATLNECERWELKRGDVLFTKDSETPKEIGIPTYVTEDMPNVLCGYHLGLARPKTNFADGAFLAEMLRSPAAGKQFARIANGVTRFGLTLDATRNLPIPLPPLAEQRAIAATLDSIDAAIEGVEAVTSATERLRGALLHRLLTRGLPGRHAKWKDAPGLGPIPARWKVVRLGDVAQVNRCNWEPTEGPPILYLDLTSVVAPGRLDNPKEIAVKDAPSRARRQVRSGDILVSTVRPYLRGFARISHAPDNLIASTGFSVLTPSSDVNNSYIYHQIMTSRFARHLEGAMTGQAYPAVRPGDVIAYRFPLPPLAEQRAIAAALDGVDRAVERSRAECDKLKQLKTSVADALLTGRVRVGPAKTLRRKV